MTFSFFLAIIAILTIVSVIAKIGVQDDADLVERMSDFSIDEIFAMNRLTISAIGFLILSVSLWSIGY